MKTRFGFVSNSSSSSFVIKRAAITESQVKMIQEHIKFARLLELDENYWNDLDAWKITANENEVSGYTLMNNFDMHLFLREIGVDKANWEKFYG
jgi:hypothetical protein